MARVELAPELSDDFDRILEHLFNHDIETAPERINDIIQALSVLESNPLIGRPAPGDLRELVIGKRNRGYIAVYRYLPEIDTVFVLTVRAQKERSQ